LSDIFSKTCLSNYSQVLSKNHSCQKSFFYASVCRIRLIEFLSLVCLWLGRLLRLHLTKKGLTKFFIWGSSRTTVDTKHKCLFTHTLSYEAVKPPNKKFRLIFMLSASPHCRHKAVSSEVRTKLCSKRLLLSVK
jgi:hypothetical protein